jgi:predicted ABC-type ATPase
LASLFIIAGPNGAGKSTNSKALLENEGIVAFDYDLELYNAWSIFSFDPAVESGVRESVSDKFLLLKQSAIEKKTSFAFETNYNTSQTGLVEQFKNSGHKTYLLFIALPSVELAIERVKDRVAKGGHSVDESTIRERYTLGLEQLDNTFHQFDVVYLWLSKANENFHPYTLHPNLNSAEVIEGLNQELSGYLPNLRSFVLSSAHK